ncbi:MAG: choice-of-anchor U domain-containing protein, partial [Dehalococcoidia bacterium]
MAGKIVSLVLILLLSLAALPLQPEHGVSANGGMPEVWVATTGSDGNHGTEAEPFATIQKGIDTVDAGGTVHVAAGTYVGQIIISKALTLEGAGAPDTFIDGGGFIPYETVVESTAADADVTISGFTIQNGYQDGVAGIFIRALNTLNLYDCTVRNNVGLGTGGILNWGTLYINRCTVSGNYGAHGGGIENRGTLYMCNCTISGNSASGSEGGGGIYNGQGDEMTSEYSTIANNRATDASAKGGGFYNEGTATFESTIVGNNTAGDAAHNNGYTEPGGVTDSNGYNLDSENSCGFNVGTDLINTDPLLGPLQDNGGPTFTHALLHGSLAIDHGIGEGFPAVDQRGVPRWQGSTCDTGAYELTQASVATSTGSGTAYFSTLNGYFTNLTAKDESALACTPREDLSFPHGLFSFTVTGITPGSSATIVIILPADMPADTEYWKCINGQWVDCTSMLGSNNSDSVLTITIRDGGLGDADGVANGVITDPGGPALVVTPPPSNQTLVNAGPQSSSPSIPAPSSQAPIGLPNIYVQSASLSADRVAPGDVLTVNVGVANRGTGKGSTTIRLYVNGEEDSSRGITLESGDSR